MGALRVATPRYEGGIQAAFHGFDTARLLKSTLGGMVFGNENIEVVARIRNDNSSVAEHVHSINSIAKGRRLS